MKKEYTEILNRNSPDLVNTVSNYFDLEETAEFIKHIEPILNDHDFDDNHRFAPVNNTEAIKAYEETKTYGCCGYYDEIIEWNGKKYMFGFNYGH